MGLSLEGSDLIRTAANVDELISPASSNRQLQSIL